MGPNQTLVIRLTAKDDGSLVVERLAGKLDTLGKETDQAASSARRLKGDLGGVEGQLRSVTGVVKTFVGAWAFKEIVGGIGSLVRQGFEYNATMQTSRLGMAALVSGLAEIRDSQGNVLHGQERWNASLAISEQLQEKLKVAALQTTANYQDLVKVMQVGLGPMFAAGVADAEKIVELTKRVAQAGGALGIPGDRLGQEIKALLKGERGPDNELANALLGGISKADFDKMREAGELYDFLMKKMESFAKAGEEAGDTLNGALSNLQDAFGQALGEATQDSVGGATAMLKDLTSEIVTFDEKGRAVFNEDFVGAVRFVAEGLVSFAADAVRAINDLERFIDGVAALKDTVTDAHYWLPWGENMTWDENIAERRATRASRNMARDQRLDPDLRAQREIERYGEVISPDLRPGSTLGAKPATQASASAAMKREAEKFKADVEKMAYDLAMVKDPIAAALAKFEKERAEMLKGAGKHGGAATVNAWFDMEIANAIEKMQTGWLKAANIDGFVSEFVKKNAEGLELTSELAKDIHGRIEEDRINAVQDGVERERRLRIREINGWYADWRKKLLERKALGEDVSAEMLQLELEAQRQIDGVNEESARKQRERILGTAEYWKKLAEQVKQQFRQIGQIVSDSVLESRDIFAGAINGFLNDLTSGQVDLMESLTSLAKDLSQVWTRAFTDILMNGENVWKQLKDMLSTRYNADGSVDYLGTMLNGAGFGGAVGGVFQREGNNAGLGGSIGGAIGSIGGPIGTVIGTVLGTYIGSQLQQGEDHIRVAIANLTLDALRAGPTGQDGRSLTEGGRMSHDFLTGDLINYAGGGSIEVLEKGISEEERRELIVQIQRRVRDEMKAWQSILDLFPEEVRRQLEELASPALSVSGGVEDADISGSNALTSLEDFLSEDLPEAAFTAYERSIRRALSLVGHQSAAIDRLFEHWGELQGHELQEAVRTYVTTFLTAIDVRDRVGGDLAAKMQEVYRGEEHGVRRSRQIREDMEELFGSMEDLTDIDDRVAAQQELNRLSEQYYQQSLANLQEIIALERNFETSIGGQREQIQLAGMDDQQKMDYFYGQIAFLRDQMAMATDPREIARLGQEIQRYVGMALGLDPTNEQNRAQLDAILADILALGGDRFEEARRIQQEEDLRAAKLLQDAAEALMGAAEALNPTTPDPTGPDNPTPTGPDNQNPNSTIDTGEKNATIAEDLRRQYQMIRDEIRNLPKLTEEVQRAWRTEADREQAEAVAEAMTRALAGMRFEVGVMEVDGYVDVDTGRFVGAAIAGTVAYIRDNPDSISSRTGA